MLNSQKYITTVPFSGLFNWSVQYLSETKISFNTAYPMVRIGDFLKRNKTAIQIDNDTHYKRTTIKVHNGGVFLRDIEIGSKIGTKNQFVINKGQFLLSKIDARNGAFGVVPSELDGGIITGNFWTFDVEHSKVNPYYLSLVVTTSEFVQFCEQASNGTTNRHYLQEPLFLDIKIPLPGIDEQNKLVEAYNAKIALASEQEVIAANLQSEIQEFLLKKLGVTIGPTKKKEGLNFVSFKDVSRWDISYLFSNSELKSRFPNIRLNECLSRFMKSDTDKSIRVETYKQPTTKFHYIGMGHVIRDSGELNEMPEVLGIDIKSQTIAIPHGYFIYGKLRPYLNKYWFNDTNVGDIVCSSEFFVFKIKDVINETFFKYIIGSIIVQKQIEELTSGARMPRINEDIFMNIVIPMPSPEVQNEIVEHINGLKLQIKSLRTEAEANRMAALKNFEQKIFQ